MRVEAAIPTNLAGSPFVLSAGSRGVTLRELRENPSTVLF